MAQNLIAVLALIQRMIRNLLGEKGVDGTTSGPNPQTLRRMSLNSFRGQPGSRAETQEDGLHVMKHGFMSYQTTSMPESNQPEMLKGDVEDMGQTPEILHIQKVNSKASSSSSSPSLIILEDEDKGTNGEPRLVSSVIFERPSFEVAKHIGTLYIIDQLNGVPMNRMLVDNGPAANLIPKSLMFKLGKTDQDMIPSSAGITDAGGVTHRVLSFWT